MAAAEDGARLRNIDASTIHTRLMVDALCRAVGGPAREALERLEAREARQPGRQVRGSPAGGNLHRGLVLRAAPEVVAEQDAEHREFRLAVAEAARAGSVTQVYDTDGQVIAEIVPARPGN